MKKCAYCGSLSQPTKEHIWPKNLISKNEMTDVYNPKKNKFFPGEPVVKDVCATCNNESLSKVDGYLSDLYEENFKEVIKAGNSASLKYSYDLLLRSLLKISYNSSRAFGNNKNTRALEKFSKYILNGGYAPQVMLRLQIVTSSTLINTETGETGDFSPKSFRSATIPYDGALSHRFLIRLVAINSYWFFIIVPFKNELPHKWREMLAGFSSWRLRPGIVVEPSEICMHIPVNKTTYFDPRLLGSLLHAEFS